MIRPNTDGDSPKVLLITRNFPPLRGGMERLNDRMFRLLHANQPACALVGPRGCATYAPTDASVWEASTGSLPAVLASSFLKGVSAARRVRPSVVLAGSGLVAPAAIMAAKACGALSAVYLHGLDIIAPSQIYKAMWLPCIRRCDRVIVNSMNTRRLAISAGVGAGCIQVVHPGTDLPRLDSNARRRFRQQHGFNDSTQILLSVGRLTTRKGLVEFVDRSLPTILAAYPTARLVIIGDQAIDALHRGSNAGIEPVREAAKLRGVGHAIKWLGTCTDAELSDAYQGADLHVFPVRDIPGDVEGFGMVAIEAAAHGLPTVAFDVGGVADAVADGCNGTLVPSEDYDALSRAVCKQLSCDTKEAGTSARRFAQRFSWDRFGVEINDALVHR